MEDQIKHIKKRFGEFTFDKMKAENERVDKMRNESSLFEPP